MKRLIAVLIMALGTVCVSFANPLTCDMNFWGYVFGLKKGSPQLVANVDCIYSQKEINISIVNVTENKLLYILVLTFREFKTANQMVYHDAITDKNFTLKYYPAVDVFSIIDGDAEMKIAIAEKTYE